MKVDAIVVGARCAGAATAMLLARGGARVVLVDRGAYGADMLSTHALMRGAVLQLDRWGVLPEIVASGTPAIRSTTFCYAETDATVPIEAKYGVTALYAPRRTLLDRLLVDAAFKSGVDIRYGVRVDDVKMDHRGRVIGISAGEGGPRASPRAAMRRACCMATGKGCRRTSTAGGSSRASAWAASRPTTAPHACSSRSPRRGSG